jgi:hypothetical protein
MTSGGALLIALLLQGPPGGGGATAAAAPTRARLDLRGATDCVSRADVAMRVAARTPRVHFVDDAAIYAQVEITSARPGSVIAEMVLATAGAAPAPRRFTARSCGEAADAIALIIAVTLDPTLKRTGGEPPDSSAKTGAVPPTAKPAGQQTATDANAPPTTVETSAAPATTTTRHFGAHLAGQTIFGPAPAVMPGVAVYGMVALDRDGVWAPALFVGVTHVWRNDLAQPGGAASFTLDAGSVDACPLRVGWSRLVARPCASALVGRLAASGTDTEDGASSARPFATAGLALTASLEATVVLTARLGVGMTLLRDAYEFGSTTFHRADRITVAASVGAGLRWP